MNYGRLDFILTFFVALVLYNFSIIHIHFMRLSEGLPPFESVVELLIHQPAATGFMILVNVGVVVSGWFRMEDAGYNKWLSVLLLVPFLQLIPVVVGFFMPTAPQKYTATPNLA